MPDSPYEVMTARPPELIPDALAFCADCQAMRWPCRDHRDEYRRAEASEAGRPA
jgi:hypothetical protein